MSERMTIPDFLAWWNEQHERQIERLEAENAKLQRNYDSCKPYRRMSDRIVEACIESCTYDELYNRCMDAIDEAEPGTRTAIEDEHVRKIMKGGER